jgi:transcription initiation factor TFIIIB Brf1 subunit/transcription initiation factor TFIIB
MRESEVAAIISGYLAFEGAACAAVRLPAVRGDGDGCCDQCGSETALHDGHYVCLGCDAVRARQLDARPEWRGATPGGGADMTRCGITASDLYTHSNLGCTASGPNKGGRGGLAGKDRCLYACLSNMSTCVTAGRVPKAVLYIAERMYKQVNDLPTARGTRRAGLAEGCVYAAFRCFGVSRSVNEVALMFGVTVPVVERGAKRVQKYLDTPLEDVRPRDFAPRFYGRGGVGLESTCTSSTGRAWLSDTRSLDDVIRTIDVVDEVGVLAGHRPATIAATGMALLAECSGVSRRAVAEVCGVAEATISRCLRLIRPHAADLLLLADVCSEAAHAVASGR